MRGGHHYYNHHHTNNNNNSSNNNIRRPTQSKVIHIGNIDDGIGDDEIINFFSQYGKVVGTCRLPKREQILVEFEKMNEAVSCVDASLNQNFILGTKRVVVNYSLSKHISQHKNNSSPTSSTTTTMNKQRKTEENSEDEIYGNERKPNHVILLTIVNANYPIDVSIIHLICQPYGEVQRIVIFRKNGVQALVEYDTIDSGIRAIQTLNKANIYSGCCQIRAEYSTTTKLNVTSNNSDRWDIQNGTNSLQAKSHNPQNNSNSPSYDNQQQQQEIWKQVYVQNLQDILRSQMNLSNSSKSQAEMFETTARLAKMTRDVLLPNSSLEMQRKMVIVIYGFTNNKWTCDYLFNLICLYGNVNKILFLKTTRRLAMIELSNGKTYQKISSFIPQISALSDELSVKQSKKSSVDCYKSSMLENGSPSYVDYTNSTKNRYTTEKRAQRNRPTFPTQILHFYNAPPSYTETKLMEIFQNAGAPIPVRYLIFSHQDSQQQQQTQQSTTNNQHQKQETSSGLLEFSNINQAIDALVLANHFQIHTESHDYLFKLCFSQSIIPTTTMSNANATTISPFYQRRNEMLKITSDTVDIEPDVKSTDSLNGQQQQQYFDATQYSKKILEGFACLYRKQILCDVIFHLEGGETVNAHRCLLAATCSYFHAMFSHDKMEELHRRDIDMPNVHPFAFRQLIDFLYLGEIDINNENCIEILKLSDMFGMEEVHCQTSNYLSKRLHPTNVLGIRQFATMHSCPQLEEISRKFIFHHFEEILQTDEFLLLNIEQLINIISYDGLVVSGEEKVFEACKKWTKYFSEEREKLFPKLFEHIRLPLLKREYLIGVVSKDRLIRKFDKCRDLIDEAKDYLLLPPTTKKNQQIHLTNKRFRSRQLNIEREVVFAVGGWCSGMAISTVEMYVPEKHQWRMVQEMFNKRCGVGVAVLYGQMYAVGGHDGQCYLKSVERYSPIQNQWSTDVAPISSCRTSVGVGVLDGFLYAVGGQDGVSSLNFAQRYDPNCNCWSNIASLNTKRLGTAVAVLDGYLYAIGGSDGIEPLNTVERYNPHINKWEFVAPMNAKRKHLGCAVFANSIYAAGGRDDDSELNTAERYDAKTNSWLPIISMNSRRSGVCLSVANNVLMAIGGFDGNAYLNTIEIYDPTKKQWKQSEGMNCRRLGGGVGVVLMANFPEKKMPISLTESSMMRSDSSEISVLKPISGYLQLMVRSTTCDVADVRTKEDEDNDISDSLTNGE
ncbi:hypothetical protein SNEBB_011074 [Seison nebaliae]|nr:hypothetical protein SNEBB_011074 [Seison nebaliae]